MNKDIAIKVENLSKVYKLYNAPIDRMKEALHPFKKKYHKEFYALNDVSFEVIKGQSVGIVGRNGSGKSTLLKIITGVLNQTHGEVKVFGRVAALLELGAGFNPEYTGMENIYFQGNLLGLSRTGVDEKISEILDFADIGEHVFQPVKTYSSGMLVRLAFAVQSIIEPEILIVDEALAVGDALFQKKCFRQLEKLRMRGVTLLFVSHDQEAVRTFTDFAILLSHGEKVVEGRSSEVLLAYRKQLHEEESAYFSNIVNIISEKSQLKRNEEVATKNYINDAVDDGLDRYSFGDLVAKIVSVDVFNEHGEKCNVFYSGETVEIRLNCVALADLEHLNLGVRIRNKEGVKIYSWGSLNQDIERLANNLDNNVFWYRKFKKNEEFYVSIIFNANLGANLYEIQASLTYEGTADYNNQRILHWIDEASYFQILVKRLDDFFGGEFNLKAKCLF